MKFEIDKGLLQFLYADDTGTYAVVGAPGKRDFSLNLRSGVYKQVSFADFGSKPKDGDKIYFDVNGTFVTLVKKAKSTEKVNEGKGGMGKGSKTFREHCF
ncbi:hypothetical protein 2050HW_00246 [Serratia phage vB_SmaM_ 2050HW]|uniref:Uncharacterized protein n=1 Tax=Serratia phage vB_SmaM_ 2050HW TaxID=2024252 RepID=A0A289YVW1_9CAUD|nr:hypothetical protein HWB23_gp246 [Serratia phage vB_SmaM_ 2050HW]ATA65581.1 hypothetical protein 2050HW_00246 [Serratia phage vB_SmaM_ 2050HW]UCR74837.1 hypothetical protein [Serratia phage BUCT660]URG14096.1 hypothetical protein [Pectobacterium phage vB_ParM-25]